ncbi:MAG: ferritin-like domain-containing protein [Actinomycetota bacterium]
MAELTTPDELLAFKLGVALRAENDVLKTLQENEKVAQSQELKDMLGHHQEETREQITNLEKCFAALGQEAKEQRSPASKGLAEEAQVALDKVDKRLVDMVIAAGALDTEHHEVACYTTLITAAEAQGHTEVVELLQQILGQEESTRDKLTEFGRKLAQEAAAAVK